MKKSRPLHKSKKLKILSIDHFVRKVEAFICGLYVIALSPTALARLSMDWFRCKLIAV